MMSASLLTVRAGRTALAHLQREGLSAADVRLIPAAAGGPKGLGLLGLDLAIFGEFLPHAAPSAPTVHLMGASIGAWRLAAACHPNPSAAIRRFGQEYCQQIYPWKPTRAYVSAYCRGIIERVLAGSDAAILAHPTYRLSVMTARGRGLLAQAGRLRTPLGFSFATLANTVSREHLGRYLERVWFVDARERSPVIAALTADPANALNEAFSLSLPALTQANLAPALLASGAIPLVLEGVNNIPQSPGTYWDGGLIDYHLALPYPASPGLVLYPHFVDRVIPGWLDKNFSRRRASAESLANVVLLAPSAAFLATLPNGRLPERKDFRGYGPDGQAARIRDWQQVVGESERLGNAFLQAVASGELAAIAKPFN